MLIAKVTGTLVATQKTKSMTGQRLLIVDPLVIDTDTGDRLRQTGKSLVAVDTVGAGTGEIVVLTQGSSARLTPETKNLPVDAVIVGIVDSVQVGNNMVFNRTQE